MFILLFPNRPAVGKCSAFQELVVYVCISDVVVVPYKTLSPERPEHEEYTEEKDIPLVSTWSLGAIDHCRLCIQKPELVRSATAAILCFPIRARSLPVSLSLLASPTNFVTTFHPASLRCTCGTACSPGATCLPLCTQIQTTLFCNVEWRPSVYPSRISTAPSCPLSLGHVIC